MSESVTGCVVCTKPREAHIGLLCTAHHQRLAEILRAVEEEAILLDSRPSMAQRPGFGGGGLASEKVPALLSVIAYRDRRTKRWEPETEPSYIPPPPKSIGPWCLLCDHETCTAWRAGRRRDLHDDEHDAGSAALASVLEEIHNWARLTREERGLSAPPTVTVTGERDLLSRQLDWVAEQPWVDEMFNDMRKILGQLQEANKTKPERPAGSCFLLTETGVCGGKIWRRETQQQAWRALADRCVAESVKTADGPAYCDTCGQEWDGADLDRLNLILEQAKREAARPTTEDGRRMLTVEEMAAERSSTHNAIRLRLSKVGARAVDGHYDPTVLDKRSRSCA